MMPTAALLSCHHSLASAQRILIIVVIFCAIVEPTARWGRYICQITLEVFMYKKRRLVVLLSNRCS